jgi:hypothetical protein
VCVWPAGGWGLRQGLLTYAGHPSSSSSSSTAAAYSWLHCTPISQLSVFWLLVGSCRQLVAPHVPLLTLHHALCHAVLCCVQAAGDMQEGAWGRAGALSIHTAQPAACASSTHSIVHKLAMCVCVCVRVCVFGDAFPRGNSPLIPPSQWL